MPKTYEHHWKIENSLSESGQSRTFIVVPTEGDKPQKHVLKINKNPKRELRFRNEVEALLKLEHDKIVKIIDVDLEDENPWYVQSYFQGGDLEQYIIGKTNPDLNQLFDFFIQICDGLQHCHSLSIYHRDIKPANIFLSEDRKTIAIGDFGLCWLPLSGPRATSTTERVGSWHFMPPEYRDGRIDMPTASGDIYSLGKLLYFLFSGGVSFDREDHRQDRWNIVFIHDKPSPGSPDAFYLEHINLLLDKMIVQNPDQRISIDRVMEQAKTTKRLVTEKFNLISGDKYAPCMYCGTGYYQPKADAPGSFGRFMGIGTSSMTTENQNFRAMVCDNCGNTQIFFIPDVKKDWFPKK